MPPVTANDGHRPRTRANGGPYRPEAGGERPDDAPGGASGARKTAAGEKPTKTAPGESADTGALRTAAADNGPTETAGPGGRADDAWQHAASRGTAGASPAGQQACAPSALGMAHRGPAQDIASAAAKNAFTSLPIITV